MVPSIAALMGGMRVGFLWLGAMKMHDTDALPDTELQPGCDDVTITPTMSEPSNDSTTRPTTATKAGKEA